MSEISRRHVRTQLGHRCHGGPPGAMGLSAAGARAEEGRKLRRRRTPRRRIRPSRELSPPPPRALPGDVTVTATFSAGVLTELVAEGAQETPDRGGKAIEQLPAAIVEAGGTAGGGRPERRHDDLQRHPSCHRRLLRTGRPFRRAQRGQDEAGHLLRQGPGLRLDRGPCRSRSRSTRPVCSPSRSFERELNREEPVIMKGRRGPHDPAHDREPVGDRGTPSAAPPA